VKRPGGEEEGGLFAPRRDPSAPEGVRIFTVTELTLALKDLLEDAYPDLWVEGEVTNLSRPASGHLYFSLKDEGAEVGAVLWRTQLRALRFDLETGMAVLVHGRLDLYAPRGQYKVVVDRIEPKGIGALQIRFEQLRKRLEAEGLFAADRKRSIPFLPRRIGIVTAPRAAAIRDLLHTIFERFPRASVLIRPAKVQGEGAAEDCAAGLRELAEGRQVDVIVLTRGGGSLEDLWAFNEEVLVRAVVACPVPVVSAIGHEIDFTLCDFAADLRAKTPTEAGVLVVPDLAELEERLAQDARRLREGLAGRVRELRERIEGLRNHWVFRRPQARLELHAQALDARIDALARAMDALLSGARHRAADLGRRLEASRPQARLARDGERLRAVAGRLETCLGVRLRSAQERYERAVDRLESRSPVAILARGYSLTRVVGERGFVVDASRLKVGDLIETTYHRGRSVSRVEEAAGDGRSGPAAGRDSKGTETRDAAG
jgi:exodeoxyribonuclease VII large subunit